MEPTPQMFVRNAVRHDVSLRGQVQIVPEHAEGGVRLSAGAGGKDGWVEADVVDMASGGLGLISMVFYPRKCKLRVRVQSTQEDGELLLDTTIRVQRVCMTDRRPAYLVGGSFDAMTEEAKQQLDRLMQRLSGDK